VVDAVLFDFGGVLTSSPFEAFATYEAEAGLPAGTIRLLNATNPDENAWARLERNEVDRAGFADLFDSEAAALGFKVDAVRVLAALDGQLRPEMVEAVRRCSARMATALLTNNIEPIEEWTHSQETDEVVGLFDVIVQSSVVGCRKPEPRFYEIACQQLGVKPSSCVFLDDLGVNLKPARAMGMATIKVLDPAQALTELAVLVGFPLG
jgi:putative hydrolase of the HAD superfamily